MAQTVLGLVGGIASGKSTVASLFAEERPAERLDADAVARRVLARPHVAAEVRRRFPEAATRSGGVDREALGRIVFRSARALRALEAITHPRIRRAIEERLRRTRRTLVLLDAPLLLETGADELCDFVVYVACPARVRRARARERGWSDGEHRAREARQWSCRRKRANADFVVDNGDGLDRTRRDVRRVLREVDRAHASRRRRQTVER